MIHILSFGFTEGKRMGIGSSSMDSCPAGDLCEDRTKWVEISSGGVRGL